jgi:hypothetical protein
MSVIGNIKVMSEGVSGITKQVKALNDELKTLGGTGNSVFSSIKGLLNFGGQKALGTGAAGNSMSSSLSSFSTSAGMGAVVSMQGMGQAIGGLAQVAAAPVVGAYGATMDTAGVVSRAGSYYQAALRSPGLSRNSLERATFSALNGGITSVGSDAQVANILANAGYNPGSSSYLSAVNQVGNAAKYLGMNNSNAAQAIAGLQSGPMGASLYQYGVTTMDSQGKSKSVSDIANQLKSIMFPNGASASQIQDSLRNGYAGLNLQGMGLSADQQQLIIGSMIGTNTSSQNKNPFDAIYKMNASQTNLQTKSEQNTLTGLNAAADTVTAFNNAMGGVITSMALFKGYLDGISGTNAGKGIKAGGKSLLSGIGNFVKGAGKVILGGAMVAAAGITDVATLGAATPADIALAAGGAAMVGSGFKGGGRPGYGGNFGGKGPRGGGTPGGSLVSADYGVTDSSGIWASTGNKHLGTDYNVAIGTPVYSVMDGIVSTQTLSSDYGNAIMVDHPNGYSTVYAHLSNKEVSPGKQVFRGQEIGKSGKSGNTTGPSLHYEVRHGANNPVDPSNLTGALSPVKEMFGNSAMYLAGRGSMSGGAGSLPNNSKTSSKDQKAWAQSVLKDLGAPATSNNINSITTWMQFEGGLNHNNPLNTTLDMKGSTTWNSEGVKTYPTLSEGTQATVETLTGNQSKSRGYDAIVNALKKGNTPTSDVLQLVNSSSWGTKIHGGGTPGYGAGISTSATLDAQPLGAVSSAVSGSAKNVYITLKIDQASEHEAVVFAKRIQTILNDQNSISVIGSK